MEAKLRAPPQDVLGAAGPLLLDEIGNLALGQALAEILAEIGHCAGGAEKPRDAGAVGAGETPRELQRKPRPLTHEVGEEAIEISARHIAAGEGRAGGPRAGKGAKVRTELLH